MNTKLATKSDQSPLYFVEPPLTLIATVDFEFEFVCILSKYLVQQ